MMDPKMMNPRPSPPVQWGSLKGLLGVPSPFCHVHISRLFDDPASQQKYKQRSQQERAMEYRIKKIIRRLLIKAGIPVLSKEESSQSHEGLFFQVGISINPMLESVISYSVGMHLIQEVFLVRDPNIKIEAVTWGGDPIRGYFRRHALDEEYLIEELVEHIIREHIREGIHSLVSSYQFDNQPDSLRETESDRSYDTGPLNES